MTPDTNTPSLSRRLASTLYDGLLVAAVLFVMAFPCVALTRGMAPEAARPILQFYLLAIAGLYFTFFWRRGQTLAMKTWGIRIESSRGGPIDWKQAGLRYVLACLNLALLGVGWWSSRLFPDRQFLQDRLSGTRLVRA